MSGIVNTVTEVASLGLIDDVTGAEAAGQAARRAADVQNQAGVNAANENRRQFDITQGNLQPRIDAGNQAIQQQQNLLGLNGSEAQQGAFDSFNESPGQKFLRDRGQRNLLRNSSAIGGLGGGNVRSALVEQGVGFAQQDFNNQFGRLGQIAGQGQAAATNVGQFGQNATNQINQNNINASEARASGILGRTQANAQATGQLLQFGGQAAGAFAAGGF
jgi:hypothetical protein